jgi:hypothetical protein
MDKEAYEELRFKAACAAMQTIHGDSIYPENTARTAIRLADTLLKELGYTMPGKPQDDKALPFSFMQGPGRPGM